MLKMNVQVHIGTYLIFTNKCRYIPSLESIMTYEKINFFVQIPITYISIIH